jgi:hypothetical protein
MTSFKKYTDVFIVRIWHEPGELEDVSYVWRGVIEHLASTEKRYFQNLEDMTAFVIAKSTVNPGKGLESTAGGERGNLLHRLLALLRLREREDL